MSNKGSSSTNLITYILIFLAITYFGADVMADMVGEWQEIVTLGKPIVGSVMMIACGVLLYRRYWNNW